jgi:hypothetical protein
MARLKAHLTLEILYMVRNVLVNMPSHTQQGWREAALGRHRLETWFKLEMAYHPSS